MALKEAIRARALASGFDAAGFTGADADPRDREHLAHYLADGRHGDMGWMASRAEQRAAPQQLWSEARTVIALGVNYAADDGASAAGPGPDNARTRERLAHQGVISVYARGRDYHSVLKKRLKAFARWLVDQHQCAVKVFVDTAPVMEKPLAQRAGIGWIGKHTNLVSRQFGSWLFLGEVFTTLPLPPDRPEPDHCGRCDACLRACPTDALREPYRIDPRACLSYLTIEHAGAIAPHLARALDNRIYGCDDCLLACPWNKFATPTRHEALRARAELIAPALAELARLDDAAFRQLFAGTAIKRIGVARFLRNIAIATNNSRRDTMP